MTQLTLTPRIDWLDGTAAACAVLSNLLLRTEAAGQMLDNLEPGSVDEWPVVRNAATVAGLEAWAATLASPPAAEDLRADFQQLFIGPGPMSACPYESVHRSKEGLSFELETHQVRHAYAEFGLQAPALNREPDDHVGLELAFIGELSVAAMNALDDGDVEAAQQLVAGAGRFVQDHLAEWVPGFADMVRVSARTSFYGGVGWLLRGAVEDFATGFPPHRPIGAS